MRELAGIRDEDSAEEAARARRRRGSRSCSGSPRAPSTADQTARGDRGAPRRRPPRDAAAASCSSTTSTGPSRRCSTCSSGSRALIDDAPLLVLCLARPELLERRPDWPVTVRLEPLGAAEIDALLESLEAPPAARVRLAHAAAGNPLFAEELVAWVREGGDVDDLPTSLNALLGARLDRLEARRAGRARARRGRGRALPPGAVVELSERAARPVGARRARRAHPQGSDPARRRQPRRARSPTASSTSSSATPPTARPTKKLRADAARALRRLARAASPANASASTTRSSATTSSRPTATAPSSAIDDDAGARRPAPPATSAPPAARANDRGDVHAAANLLGRATALLPRRQRRAARAAAALRLRARRVRASPRGPGDQRGARTSGRPRSESEASRRTRASCAPAASSGRSGRRPRARRGDRRGGDRDVHGARRRGRPRRGTRDDSASICRHQGRLAEAARVARARTRARERVRRPGHAPDRHADRSR